MKNKKLFAILTLVCFMFTLMPVAAFAADAEASLSANSATTVDSVTVTLTGADTTTHSYYVYALDSNDELYTALDATGEYRGVAPITNTLALTFPDADTYEVIVIDVPNASTGLKNIITGVTYVGMADYVAALADADEVDFARKNTVRVKANESAYQIKFYEGNTVKTTIDVASDNGFSNTGEVTVELLYANNEPVKYADIEFTTNSGYVTVEKIDAETDKNGKMEIKVAATKAGIYEVYAQYGNTEAELTVDAAVSNVAGVKAVATPKTPVALGDAFASYTGIAFEFVDASGTVLGATALGGDVTIQGNTLTLIDGEGFEPAALMAPDFAATNESDIKVTVVEAPADSAWLGEEIALKYDSNTNKAWTLYGGSFDEEGTYTFKVALANGASATASVTVKEFGEPVAMKLIYNEDSVGLNGASATVKAVTLLDANYTSKTIYNGTTGYTTGYANKLDFVASGIAVNSCQDTNQLGDGTIVTKTVGVSERDEYIGTTISAMVIYDDEELIATAELDVVDSANALKYVDKTAELAVNNDLEVVLVDKDGKEVDYNFVTGDALKVYVLEAPKNAAYDIRGVVDTTSDELSVSFTASAAGEYKLQTVLTYGGGYLSTVETVVVDGTVATFDDIVVVSLGADSMIVNNEVVKLDVAPFIENNRTMMQFNVLYVFGIDVQWVAESQSIVAEGNGLKVVMTLGSKVATVNGEEVALDVAPYTVNGRTVVPVGFVTGTFGIAPTFTYNADGSIADILFTK